MISELQVEWYAGHFHYDTIFKIGGFWYSWSGSIGNLRVFPLNDVDTTRARRISDDEMAIHYYRCHSGQFKLIERNINKIVDPFAYDDNNMLRL